MATVKFFQICTGNLEGQLVIFGLDCDGRVWFKFLGIHSTDNKWQLISSPECVEVKL